MYFTSQLEIALRKLSQINSRRALRRNRELWVALQEYLEKTESTGCGYIDYACLYETIRKLKPVEILECGTGVSTLIIAHALKENEIETGVAGHVYSMEEHAEWLEMSKQLLPAQYHRYVSFELSHTIEDRYSIFRGVRYANIPNKAYDFVFVDGPKYDSPVDGGATFDFDFIHVLKSAEKPVSCLIDKRLSTVFVLQQLLGTDKVTYSAVAGLGQVRPCTKRDLGTIATSISSDNFTESFRVFRNSKLSIVKNR